MWIAMIVQAAVVAVVVGLISLVVRIDDWWPYIGIITVFYVVDFCVLFIFRDIKHRMIANYSLSAVILFLFLFGWIDPGPPFRDTYLYASSKVKAQIADYRIKDSVGYLAKNSAPAAKIFRDFPDSRSRLIAAIRYDYERLKYRGKLAGWVNNHLNRFVASYARRYVATSSDKAALAYFHALVVAVSYNRYQQEQECMRYLTGDPIIRSVINQYAGTDVTNRIKQAENALILSGHVGGDAPIATTDHGATAKQIIAQALDENAPRMKQQSAERQRLDPRPGCDVIAAIDRRVRQLPPDRAGPVVKQILAHFFAIDPSMKQQATVAPRW